MSDLFDAAMRFTGPLEGGFSDNPNDPGGATNYGVSLRALLKLEGGNLEDYDLDQDGDIDRDDILLLTESHARQFYAEHYWHDYLEQISDDRLAIKVYDVGVNAGKRLGGKLLQRSARLFEAQKNLAVDGAVGPRTLDLVNLIIEIGHGDSLLEAFCQYQAKFYFDLVDANTRRKVFLLGWLRRAYKVPGQDFTD